MLIEVKNNGIKKDGYCGMCVKLIKVPIVSPLRKVYFLAALKGMYDTDNRAFLDAVDLVLSEKLEENDEE